MIRARSHAYKALPPSWLDATERLAALRAPLRRAARDESLATIGELSAQRKAGARLVVAGCMAGSLYRSEIEAAFGSQVAVKVGDNL